MKEHTSEENYWQIPPNIHIHIFAALYRTNRESNQNTHQIKKDATKNNVEMLKILVLGWMNMNVIETIPSCCLLFGWLILKWSIYKPALTDNKQSLGYKTTETFHGYYQNLEQ